MIITYKVYSRHDPGTLPFKDAKTLITGGLGFIGSSLARRLVQQGAKVTLVDSLIPEYGGNLFNIHDIADRVTVNISDVRDEHSFKYLIQNQDFLFNLAGQSSHLDSMVNPKNDLDINAAAQLSILEAARHYNPNVRIVFASTRQLYGKPKYLPVDEKHPINPVDVNGINKLAGEWYHLLYNNVYGISASVLRLTNTYGPGMRIKDARQTFLGIWIRNLLEGKPIRVFGNGEQLRDFNFVDDCVEALLAMAVDPKAQGHLFNLGGHEVIALKDLAQLLVEVAGQGEIDFVDFPAERKSIDIGDYYSNYHAIESLLGWKPATALKEGLTQTVAYFRTNLSHYL